VTFDPKRAALYEDYHAWSYRSMRRPIGSRSQARAAQMFEQTRTALIARANQ